MKPLLLSVVFFLTLMPSAWSQETKLIPLVLQAERDVGDLTAPGALHESKAFIEIRDNPRSYVEEALVALADPKLSLQQKMIVAYGMQRLGKADYLSFLSRAAERFEKAECPGRIMELLILPGVEWGVLVIENYNDPSVKRTLNAVKQNAQTSVSFRATIENIPSGKTWDKVRRFLADQPKR